MDSLELFLSVHSGNIICFVRGFIQYVSMRIMNQALQKLKPYCFKTIQISEFWFARISISLGPWIPYIKRFHRCCWKIWDAGDDKTSKWFRYQHLETVTIIESRTKRCYQHHCSRFNNSWKENILSEGFESLARHGRTKIKRNGNSKLVF